MSYLALSVDDTTCTLEQQQQQQTTQYTTLGSNILSQHSSKQGDPLPGPRSTSLNASSDASSSSWTTKKELMSTMNNRDGIDHSSTLADKATFPPPTRKASLGRSRSLKNAFEKLSRSRSSSSKRQPSQVDQGVGQHAGQR